MNYVKLSDHSVCDESGVRQAAYPSVLAPDIPVPMLADLGFARLIESEPPSVAPWEMLQTDIVQNGAVFELVYTPLDLPEPEARAARLQHIADKRFQVETQGININGVQVPTDRHTQQVLTAMYVRAMADENYIVNFKADNGFVTLTAPEIIYIGDVVSEHVQAAFQREQELTALIEAGEAVTAADW